MSAASALRSRSALLIAAALLGVGLRLGFGLGYWIDRPLTRDELEYFSLARSLAAGDGFVYDETMRAGSFEPFGRAPGYPAFLALAGGGREVVSSVPARVKIAQAIVGGIGVLLVGLVATPLAGPRGGLVAAWIAAVYPPLVLAQRLWRDPPVELVRVQDPAFENPLEPAESVLRRGGCQP